MCPPFPAHSVPQGPTLAACPPAWPRRHAGAAGEEWRPCRCPPAWWPPQAALSPALPAQTQLTGSLWGQAWCPHLSLCHAFTTAPARARVFPEGGSCVWLLRLWWPPGGPSVHNWPVVTTEPGPGDPKAALGGKSCSQCPRPTLCPARDPHGVSHVRPLFRENRCKESF